MKGGRNPRYAKVWELFRGGKTKEAARAGWSAMGQTKKRKRDLGIDSGFDSLNTVAYGECATDPRLGLMRTKMRLAAKKVPGLLHESKENLEYAEKTHKAEIAKEGELARELRGVRKNQLDRLIADIRRRVEKGNFSDSEKARLRKEIGSLEMALWARVIKDESTGLEVPGELHGKIKWTRHGYKMAADEAVEGIIGREYRMKGKNSERFRRIIRRIEEKGKD